MRLKRKHKQSEGWCRNQLKDGCLDVIRFYSNDPDRSYTRFRQTAQLTDRMLRLLLCSRRIYRQLIGESYSSSIYVLRSSFHIHGVCAKYYTTNVILAAQIARISRFASKYRRLHVSSYAANLRLDKAIIRLLYFAKKVKIDVSLPECLRTRVVEQVIHDLGMYVTTSEDDFDVIYAHYGVDFKLCPGQFIDDISFRLMNDVGKCRKIELDHAHVGVNNWWSTQKQIIVRRPYLQDVFQSCYSDIQLKTFDFLVIYQYLPLPSMPHLTSLQADLRLQSICPASLKVFEELATEFRRVSPNVVWNLKAEISISCRTYDGHYDLLKDLIGKVEQLHKCTSAVRRPIICFKVFINVHLPVSEQSRGADWTQLVSEIHPFYKINYNQDEWQYNPNYPAPPEDADDSRFEFKIRVRFMDELLLVLVLGDRNILVIE